MFLLPTIHTQLDPLTRWESVAKDVLAKQESINSKFAKSHVKPNQPAASTTNDTLSTVHKRMQEIHDQLVRLDSLDPPLRFDAEDVPDSRSLDERLYVGADLIEIENSWRPPQLVPKSKPKPKAKAVAKAKAQASPGQDPKKDGCIIA